MAEQTPHAENTTKSSVQTKDRTQQLPPYNVVLLNDNDHTYEYVIHMLQSLFGHNEEMGFKLARTVDKDGRAIVATTHKERAEFKRDQILGFGMDPRIASCKGSMSSVIEPAND